MELTCQHCQKTFQNRHPNQKYCTTTCYGLATRGENHYAYKGGGLNDRGYRRVTVDRKRDYLHRIVMAQKLGRPLTPDEEVHHVNLDRDDNRPENLELCSTKKQHTDQHVSVFRSETHKECTMCHETKPRSEFTIRDRMSSGTDPHRSNCKACDKIRKSRKNPS